MKARIFSIMDMKKKKAGVLLLCVVFIAIIGTGAVFAIHSTKASTEENRADDGQAIALAAPVEAGRITTRDGQNLSITLNGGGYNNFAELPFQKGEKFTLSVTSQEERELEIGLLSISTDQEYGEVVKTGTGTVSITIPEDGEYRIYVRNHAADAAEFTLQLSKAIEGPIV